MNFKEKAIKNKKAIKNIQNSINSETKQLIKEVEFIKQTPQYPRDQLKDKVKKIQDELDTLKDLKPDIDVKPINDTLSYLKTIPAHLRTRLMRLMRLFNMNLDKKIKEERLQRRLRNTDIKMEDVDDEVEFIKQVPSHPRDRFQRREQKARQELESIAKDVAKQIEERDNTDVVYLKTTPAHPRDRFQRKARQLLESIAKNVAKQIEERDDMPIYVKTTPAHPRYRFQRKAKEQLKTIAKDVAKQIEEKEKRRLAKIKQPKVYLENEVMRDLPNFNTKIKVTKTSLIGRENQIYNSIIKQLPPNNDKYYIEYSEENDAYIVRKDK